MGSYGVLEGAGRGQDFTGHFRLWDTPRMSMGPSRGGDRSVPSLPFSRRPGEAVAQLCSSDDSCEVDPSKCGGPDLSDNQNNLRQVCEETLQRIATSCE